MILELMTDTINIDGDFVIGGGKLIAEVLSAKISIGIS